MIPKQYAFIYLKGKKGPNIGPTRVFEKKRLEMRIEAVEELRDVLLEKKNEEAITRLDYTLTLIQ